jgi:DNA-binding SARP family transcriptional activator
MRAHVNLGNRAAAKDHFENLRLLLERELGIEPSRETRRTYQELLGKS